MSPRSEIRDNKGQLLFWSLVVLAFSLRLWGIWHVSATDEYNEVFEALRVCSGHLNFERWAKRFYLYILAGEYGVYFGAGWLTGHFAGPMDFAEKIVRQMEPLFIMGRVTSVLAGAASVGVLYRIGEKFFNRQTAVIAGLLLTFTVFHIELSQQAKVDATLGLLVLLSLYFMLNVLQHEASPRRNLAWAGLCMGLAIQAKINTVVLFVPFSTVLFFRLRDHRGPVMRPVLTAFGPLFLLGFVLGNPPVALAPLKFLRDISGIGQLYTTAVNVVPSEHIGFVAYPLYFFNTMGAVAILLAAAALLHALLRPDRTKLVLLSFLAAFYLIMGASRFMVADYYMIPAVPVLYLLIGDLFARRVAVVGLSRLQGAQAGGVVVWLLLPMALVVPIKEVAVHELSLAGPHTRYLARDWIEANIPSGSKILMDSGKSINSFAPPIAENRVSLERVLGRAQQNVAAGKIVNDIVDRNALIYYRLLLKTVPEISYDITSTMFGLEVEDIGHYLETGFDYFIISDHFKKARTNQYFAARNPKEAGFYRALDQDERLRLVGKVEPSRMNAGDTFYIYRLQRGG